MKHFGRASLSAMLTSVIAAGFFMAIRGDAAELVNTIKAGKPSLVTWPGLEGAGVGMEIPAGMLLTQRDLAHGDELWITNGAPAGTHLVRDINPGSEGSAPAWFYRVGDVAVFQASDGIHGLELWRSDGTEAGTYMLADIGPGKQSSRGTNVLMGAVLDGVMYFTADDGVSGSELWRTDGTREGTFLAVDIVSGYAGSDPADLTVAGNHLYFHLADGLWISDGTPTGTHRIADLHVIQCCVAAGDALFFSANDEVHGIELWRAVGQTVAMVQNLNTYPVGGGQDDSSYPQFTTAWGESLLFIAQVRASPGAANSTDCKLFRADASGGGATELRNFNINCSFGKFIKLPGGMMFSLQSVGGPAPGQHDELWVSNGTAAGTMPLDLNGLYYSTVLLNDYHFKVAYGPNGEAYFFGTVGSGQPDKIWRTDGTRAGTRVFADLSSRSAQQEIIWFNGQVYFDAGGNTTIPDTGLWTSDGTVTGTKAVRVGDISNITDLRIANGRLQFWSATADPNERELWSSDGTGAGTVYLGNHSDVTSTAAVDASVVFAGQLGSRAVFAAQLDAFALGRELSITDGTKGSTSLIRNINTGGTSDPSNFLTLGDQILFVAHDFDHGRELWRTDGTESGTFQLQDIARFDGNVTLGGPDTIINGVAYFTAGENTDYPDLWRTDGTIAGTYKIPDILALRISILGGNGNVLLFRAFKPADGATHLYSWNGSQAQIIAAADGLKITSDPGVTFDGRVCFRAWNVDPRYVDVWCASGTQGDVVRATNFAALSLSAGEMHRLGNKLLVNVPGSGPASGLYFTQGVAGTSQRISGERIRTATSFGSSQLVFLSESGILMLTDGTSARTRNLLQGATLPGSISGAFGVLGSYVVFVVNDPARGAVLWRSDGTPVGTRYVADLDPATVPAGIQESAFFTLDNRLLYSGYRKGFANEMWSLNATDPNASNDVLAATAGSAISAAVLDNDADFDGVLNAGSVSIVTQPSHGTAVVNATTGAISYTANSTYNGADELTYRVADNQGNNSNVATLSIQVTGGVSAPPPPPAPPPSSGGGGGGGGALGLEILALLLFALRKAASIQSRLIGRTGWNSRRLGGFISMTASTRG